MYVLMFSSCPVLLCSFLQHCLLSSENIEFLVWTPHLAFHTTPVQCSVPLAIILFQHPSNIFVCSSIFCLDAHFLLDCYSIRFEVHRYTRCNVPNTTCSLISPPKKRNDCCGVPHLVATLKTDTTELKCYAAPENSLQDSESGLPWDTTSVLYWCVFTVTSFDVRKGEDLQ